MTLIQLFSKILGRIYLLNNNSSNTPKSKEAYMSYIEDIMCNIYNYNTEEIWNILCFVDEKIESALYTWNKSPSAKFEVIEEDGIRYADIVERYIDDDGNYIVKKPTLAESYPEVYEELKFYRNEIGKLKSEFYYDKFVQNTSSSNKFVIKEIDDNVVWKGKFRKDNLRNEKYFYDFEKGLFNNHFINSDYNFISNRKKNQLAAIYQILIDREYFRMRQANNKINRTDIRKFLDYRYNVDTSDEFKPSRLTKNRLSDAEIKNPWLNNLPKF